MWTSIILIFASFNIAGLDVNTRYSVTASGFESKADCEGWAESQRKVLLGVFKAGDQTIFTSCIKKE